jgi:hypothetical protein
MLGCCANFWGDFGGNVFEDGLFKTINSGNMKHARNILLGKVEPKDGIPCTTCNYYLAMEANSKWVERRLLWIRRMRLCVLRTVIPIAHLMGLHHLRRRLKSWK